MGESMQRIPNRQEADKIASPGDRLSNHSRHFNLIACFPRLGVTYTVFAFVATRCFAGVYDRNWSA